jgi:hypothetical protein
VPAPAKAQRPRRSTLMNALLPDGPSADSLTRIAQAKSGCMANYTKFAVLSARIGVNLWQQRQVRWCSGLRAQAREHRVDVVAVRESLELRAECQVN